MGAPQLQYAIPAGGGVPVGVSGAGTVNRLTKWSAATTIADSGVSDDGSTVTFNARNLSSTLAQTWTLYSSSTAALNIQSGLLNIDTTNSRVGIGTASPSDKLTISGGGLAITGSITGATTAANSLAIDSSGGSSRLFSIGASPSSYGNFVFNANKSGGSPGSVTACIIDQAAGVLLGSTATAVFNASTSGQGLKLPAAPGNADAQTLDCYQELGAVTVAPLTTTGTITLSANDKIRVTRIGNCVYGSGYLVVASVSTVPAVTGRLSFILTGCPKAWINFPCLIAIGNTNAIPAGSVWFVGSDTGNPPTIFLDRYDGAAQQTDMAPYIKAGTSIQISFVYVAI